MKVKLDRITVNPAVMSGNPCIRGIFILLAIACFKLAAFIYAQEPVLGELGSVDFRYAPPWWQSAICLPDDPDKALVGKDGQLLLDFGGGGVRNFGICLQPEITGGSYWIRQRTFSPRVPIIQTLKNANGVEILEETFVVTPSAKLVTSSPGVLPERQAVVLITLANTNSSEVTCQPSLRVQSASPVRFAEGGQSLLVGEGTRVSASEHPESQTVSTNKDFVIRLPAVTLKPGASHQVAFTVDRHLSRASAPLSVQQARELRDAAQLWWERADLPFDTIQVPDPGIQAMLESCVRNIWQAREIKQGKPAFHVGPTVYRGLWVVDGSFLLESAALLGRGDDARAGVEYLLSHQKPDGSFEIIGRFWKENGIVLWAATRHAFLTQDKAWLRTHWPALQRVVKAIQTLRAAASKDPQALEYQLLPPGFVDGGIGSNNKPEYSNTCWCLAGLKAAIEAARWLGDDDSAAVWQKEYDDFYAAYRRAVTRDTLKDRLGNSYVPTMMGNLDQYTPARGQWAFCHAVYPGQIFPKEDTLVEGQLAMLRATKVQGMVYDTGWMREGIWTYFASFYGHAELWQGRGRQAAQVLYDFARHAATVRVWREEQKPVRKGGQEVGDMPHNWASAEFIRLTTHLIELDRGRELHLLEGFPKEWADPGMVTRLNGVLTPFGPLHLEIRVAADGNSIRVKMSELKGDKPAKIMLHLNGLTGEDMIKSLPVNGDVDLSLTRTAGGSQSRTASQSKAAAPIVEIEEDVYHYESANNGAGPMWCGGSTCLVRIGDDIFASGLETLKDAKPLNNCRWILFQRGTNGWEKRLVDEKGRTREPSPLAAFGDGRLLLSANPTLVTDPATYSGPARPEILLFSNPATSASFETLAPKWEGKPQFTEHSYRSFAADGIGKELILFQNIGYTHAAWTFRDKDGQWSAQGKLIWPWGAEYDKPQPIRVCYPTVALKNRAVHFCGVSDIVEPYDQWRTYKKQLTNQEWDYDFRRLFYTWTPDITTGGFSNWVEIASRDKTCGWLSPCDLWVAPNGDAHILWSERAIDERLRDKFFPGVKQSHTLNYAIVSAGKVPSRRILIHAEEGGSREIPGLGRFQVTPDNRLFVFYYLHGTDKNGRSLSENRLMELLPDGSASQSLRVPLRHPFNNFFTATIRGGSPASNTLELLGQKINDSQTISYARIKL